MLSIPLTAVVAQTLPLTAFSASPRISDAAISPDGRYLAIITSIKKAQTLVVQDRTVSGPGGLHAVIGAADGFDCRGATGPAIRGSCAVCMRHTEAHGMVVSKTRLVGADADGKNVKVLMEFEDTPGYYGARTHAGLGHSRPAEHGADAGNSAAAEDPTMERQWGASG